ncbi:hypothetical protein N7507_003386 [Penicillium longicatenatum]|nr:hypothetical protein N7507_003386 [Penicillium longicatenatum]
MSSVSVNGGWTFTNVGPMTTTFTPAPTCTNNIFVGDTGGVPNLQWPVDCAADSFSGCTPSSSVTTATTRNLNSAWEINYFSPGLYCPSGWATKGAISHDKSTSHSSGILTEHRVNSGDWDNPATMLARIMKPGETLALCCPSSMTADFYITGCYSEISSYTPTAACYKDAPEEDYGDYTKTFTYNALTITEYFNFPTGKTEPTETEIFDLNGWSKLVGFSAVPMVTLVHHQSDLDAAKAITAVTTAAVSRGSESATSSVPSASTDTEPDSDAATSSSAARRLNPAGPAWDGLGVVVGASIAAAALGALIVFP